MKDELERYYNEIKDIPSLSVEEQQLLIKKAQLGDKTARNLLVLSCLKYAFKRAEKFYDKREIESKQSCRLISLDDLVQEATLGLFEAVEKYNTDKYKVNFVNYGSYWVFNKMQKYWKRNKDPISRVPPYMEEHKASYLEFQASPETEDPNELNELQLARKIKIPQSSVSHLRLLVKRFPVNLEASKDSKSLREDFLLSNPNRFRELKFEAKISMTQLRSILEEILSQLTQRERRIIKGCYGIDSEIMTQVELGMEFDISRTRVGQLRRKATKKMKARLIEKKNEGLRKKLWDLHQARMEKFRPC